MFFKVEKQVSNKKGINLIILYFVIVDNNISVVRFRIIVKIDIYKVMNVFNYFYNCYLGLDFLKEKRSIYEEE